MAHTITNRCTQCNACFPHCPTGAIKIIGQELWIDPMVCDDCQGSTRPQCVAVCPIPTPPVPLQAKKGRCKSDSIATSPQLFPNGKTHAFASAIVVWEASNILAQRQSLFWQTDELGNLEYQRLVNGGRGRIAFHVSTQAPPNLKNEKLASPNPIETWDIRAACLHLIYAAYAASLESPWEQTFTLSDREISDYLGLGKRKDLSKLAKLTLIKQLVEQPCQLRVSLDWSSQGKFEQISFSPSQIWHLLHTQHHFQTDDLGCKHLTGLTFTLKAGQWSRFFLNRQAAREGTAFYQYGMLPQSILVNVMSNWQQHEGAIRIMLWLLFKLRLGIDQRITIPTLMRIAYGEEKLSRALNCRDERKRLVRSFESDLEVLNYYGLKPVFDPDTYPLEIQPLWVKLADLPDDAEAALEFWTDDGSKDVRLTDAAPANKWQRLMHARLLRFELPQDWMQKVPKATKRSKRKAKKPKPTLTGSTLSGQQIALARKHHQLSQRALAQKLGKSQSWVRDVEKGRLQVNEKDQPALYKLLGITAAD